MRFVEIASARIALAGPRIIDSGQAPLAKRLGAAAKVAAGFYPRIPGRQNNESGDRQNDPSERQPSWNEDQKEQCSAGDADGQSRQANSVQPLLELRALRA